MTEETRDALLGRLKSDEALRQAIAKAASTDDVVRVLGDAGFAVGASDVAMGTGRPTSELTDADLEGLAGGGFTTYGCNTPTQYFVFTHCYP